MNKQQAERVLTRIHPSYIAIKGEDRFRKFLQVFPSLGQSEDIVETDATIELYKNLDVSGKLDELLEKFA